MLNKYFSMCWNKELPLSETTATTYNDNGSERDSGDIICTEEVVYHYLISLDIAKAYGPDNTLLCMLKETASSVVPSLTQLLKLSISLGKLPRI